MYDLVRGQTRAVSETGLTFKGEWAALACVGEEGMKGKAGQGQPSQQDLKEFLRKGIF